MTLNEGHRTLLVGCGKVGTRLGERLVDEGTSVFAVRRTTADLPASFTPLAIDLRKPLDEALPAVDSMVITLPPGAPPAPGETADYLVSLTNLAAALPAVPQRVIFVSSTRVFEGLAGERPISEADAPLPVSERGETLREGEVLASELFDATIVRPAGIYGPGREMLLRKVREAAPVQYARRTNRIHETDLVRALHALLAAEEPPRILHAVDQSPAPLGDVVTYIAREMGLAAPPRIEPAEASGTVLDGARLIEFLGSLEYPDFRAGYGEMVAGK